MSRCPSGEPYGIDQLRFSSKGNPVARMAARTRLVEIPLPIVDLTGLPRHLASVEYLQYFAEDVYFPFWSDTGFDRSLAAIDRLGGAGRQGFISDAVRKIIRVQPPDGPDGDPVE